MMRVWLLLLLSAPPALAENACVDQSRIENEILPHVELRSGNPYDPFVSCGESEAMGKMMPALLFLKDLPDFPHGRDAVDSGILGADPFAFFLERIRTIQFESASSASCGAGVLAFVRRLDPVIHVCPRSAKVGLLENADTVVHETRHTDAPGYGHVDCLDGTAGACDPSLEFRGSYAVGAEFKVKVARSDAVNEAVRQEARAGAIYYLLNRFNQRPLGLRRGTYLQDVDGRIHFYDGSQLALVWEGKPHQLFTGRYGIPALFDPADGSVKSYNFGSALVDTEGGIAKEYRQNSPGFRREELLDIAYGSDYSCKLYERAVVCGDSSGPEQEIPLEGIRPLKLVQVSRSSLLDLGSMHVAAADGRLYALPASMKVFAFFRTLIPSQHSLRLVSLVPLGPGLELGITLEGRAMLYSEQTKTWAPAPGIPEGARFQKASGEADFSRELEKI